MQMKIKLKERIYYQDHKFPKKPYEKFVQDEDGREFTIDLFHCDKCGEEKDKCFYQNLQCA